MESNIQLFFQNVENENEEMHASLEGSVTENIQLREENDLLKHALEKQKVLHRKYVEEVTTTEASRLEEFNNSEQQLIKEIQLLSHANKQLLKDAEFYKNAYMESTQNQSMNSTIVDSLRGKIVSLEKDLDKEKSFHRKYVEDIDANAAIRQKDTKKNQRDCTNENTKLKKLNRQLLTDVAFYKKACESKSLDEISQPRTVSYVLPSKVKQEKKLYEDNKKLQLKIIDLTSIVQGLKKKNKQLKNFQNKINNKKSKFDKDSEELKGLFQTNKDTYTPEVLAMVLNLAKKKK